MWVNATESFCEPGARCGFAYGDGDGDTPIVTSVSPREAIYDEGAWFAGRRTQLVTLRGRGLAPGNTTVTIGGAVCEVVEASFTSVNASTTVSLDPDRCPTLYVSTNASTPCNHTIATTAYEDEFQCALPKHAAGVYTLAVHVDGRGLADGEGLWFRFGLELAHLTPRRGSTLGGTTITITGRGFATCEPLEDARGLFGGGLFEPAPCAPETLDGRELVNRFDAYDGAYFDAIVVRSSWSEIVALATLRANSECTTCGACDTVEPAVVRVGVGYADGAGANLEYAADVTLSGVSSGDERANDGLTSGSYWDKTESDETFPEAYGGGSQPATRAARRRVLRAWCRRADYLAPPADGWSFRAAMLDVGAPGAAATSYGFFTNNWRCPTAWRLYGRGASRYDHLTLLDARNYSNGQPAALPQPRQLDVEELHNPRGGAWHVPLLPAPAARE